MPSSNTEKVEDSAAESFLTARDELEVKSEVKEGLTDKQNGGDVDSNDETGQNQRANNGRRGGRRRNVRNFSEDQPKPEKKLLAKCLKGTVAWYSVRDCYGFIKRDDGEKDVFVHQMAIIKSYMRQTRYRSLAEDEPVEFDLSEGRNGRYEAINVTGPEGRNVVGTSIVVRKLGNYGPRRVMGIDEDYGFRPHRSQFRRSRAKPEIHGDKDVEASDIEVKEAKNVDVKEASAEKAIRPRGGRRYGRYRRRGKNSDDPKKDDKAEAQENREQKKESGDQKKESGDQNIRRSWRRNAQRNSKKEPRQSSDARAAQSASQSNTESPKTSAPKPESSTASEVPSASGDIVQKRIAQWQSVSEKTKNEPKA